MGLPWGGLLGMIAALPVELWSRIHDFRTRRPMNASNPAADAPRYEDASLIAANLAPDLLPNTRQSDPLDAEETQGGRPTFNWQERYLLDCLEYRSEETDWFSVIYFTAAAICLLWGLYLDEPIFILTGAFVVATGRCYENKTKATFLPIWRSIIAKYESALDDALHREETPPTVDHELDDNQIPMKQLASPLDAGNGSRKGTSDSLRKSFE